MNKRFGQIKRVAFDLLCLIGAAGVFFLLPDRVMPAEALYGCLAVVLTKILVISAGVLYAHVSRKLLFSYIDFSKEQEWSNNLMVVAWYIVVIWAFARGG